MLSEVPTTPLPRLDVQSAGGLWRLRHRLSSPRARRAAFNGLLLDDGMYPARKISRLRTLVDIGLWEPAQNNEFWQSERRMFSMCLFGALTSRKSPACEKVFHLAMEAGADPQWFEAEDHNDNFLNFFARNAMLRHFKVALAAGVSPYQQDNSQQSALAVLLKGMASPGAKRSLSVRMAEMLVANGVDINGVGDRYTGRGDYPPHPLLCALGYSPDFGLPWMLANGVDIKSKDHEGNSLAHWLCQSGEGIPSQINRFLGGAHMDVHCANNHGETPLWFAVRSGNQLAVKDLLERGVSLDVRSTAAHMFDPVTAPRPGRSLLQMLMEECEPSDWALSLASKIEQIHPDCWSWSTPQGMTMAKWVNQCSEEPAWRAMASRKTLDETVNSPPVNAEILKKPAGPARF